MTTQVPNCGTGIIFFQKIDVIANVLSMTNRFRSAGGGNMSFTKNSNIFTQTRSTNSDTELELELLLKLSSRRATIARKANETPTTRSHGIRARSQPQQPPTPVPRPYPQPTQMATHVPKCGTQIIFSQKVVLLRACSSRHPRSFHTHHTWCGYTHPA